MNNQLIQVSTLEGVLLSGAVHSFKPHQAKMAKEVSKFVIGK